MNSNPIKIAPSLLAADFAHLATEIRKVEEGGCDLLHLDVMDGHFVPNITIGPFIVKAIRKITKLPLDAHLMIENPMKYIDAFADAGADHITVHAEACENNLEEVLKKIKSRNIGCGVSLRPPTPIHEIEWHLKQIDMVLLMTVEPGFGGQAFMPHVLDKVRDLRKRYSKDIEVDGGINKETSKEVLKAGANVLVAGTAIFGQSDIPKAIRELRG